MSLALNVVVRRRADSGSHRSYGGFGEDTCTPPACLRPAHYEPVPCVACRFEACICVGVYKVQLLTIIGC